MSAINWDTDLTEEEKGKLSSDEQTKLSLFYQKLLANTRIQSDRLDALESLCANLRGGITDVSVSTDSTTGETTLTFVHDGPNEKNESTVTLKSKQCKGIASIADTTKAGEKDKSYTIKCDGANAEITAKAGPQGKSGGDGTVFYDDDPANGIKYKESLTGASFSITGVSASVTGASIGVTGFSLSFCGLSCSATGIYNSTSVLDNGSDGVKNIFKAGAYKVG